MKAVIDLFVKVPWEALYRSIALFIPHYFGSFCE